MGSNDTIIDIILRATNQTKAALTAPIQDLEDLKGAILGANKLWAGLGAAALYAGKVMEQEAIDTGANAYLMAEKIGVTTESYTENAYAADQMGVSSEAFEKGFKKLSKTIEDAAQGNEKAVALLKDFGVSATDAAGKIKPMDEVLAELADGFSRYPDGAAKAELAQQLFGRAGMALIPVLDQGRAGLEQMEAKARDLGIVLDGDSAEALLRIQQSFKDTKAATLGLAESVAVEAEPALVVLNSMFTQGAEKSDLFGAGLSLSGVLLKEVATSAVLLASNLNLVEDVFVGWAVYAAAPFELIIHGFRSVKAEFEGISDDLTANNQETNDRLKKIWGFEPIGPQLNVPGHKTDLESLLSADMAAKQKQEQMRADARAKAKEEHDLAIDAFKSESLAEIQAALDVYHQKTSLNAQDLRDIKKLEEDKAKILQAAHDQEIEKMRHASVEQLQAAIAVYAAKKSLTLQEQKDYGKLQADLVDADQKRVEDFKGTMSYLASASKSSNSTLAAIGKAAAIQQALVDGYAAEQKALGSAPPPLNFVLMAAVGAVAAGNVAAIAGVQGFALGGDVGGSSFTGDNVLIRANSGERVQTAEQADRTSMALLGALQALGGGDGGGSGGSLTVNQTLNIDGRPFFQAIWDAGLNGRLRIPKRALI